MSVIICVPRELPQSSLSRMSKTTTKPSFLLSGEALLRNQIEELRQSRECNGDTIIKIICHFFNVFLNSNISIPNKDIELIF